MLLELHDQIADGRFVEAFLVVVARDGGEGGRRGGQIGKEL